jgi:predicted O-methyltransferase YrrM
VSFLFDKWGHLIRPKQVRWEITELTKIVEDLKPQTVLEIGTARGGTLFLFTRLATENATIVSLDLPWEDGGGYPAWRTKVYKKFATPKQKLHLLRANSHHQGTQERLREILEEKIDFLFIDGDHTYAGVKKDYEFYSPMVRIGGIIAFHDIAQHKSSPECQVDHFWNEIRLEKNFKELIATPPRDWGGIGVIFT